MNLHNIKNLKIYHVSSYYVIIKQTSSSAAAGSPKKKTITLNAVLNKTSFTK